MLALLMPRFVIVLLVIFSDYIGRAYDGILWPLLGFFFMPLTTLAAAWSLNTHGAITGTGLVAVSIAVIFDLGLMGGAEKTRRRNASD